MVSFVLYTYLSLDNADDLLLRSNSYIILVKIVFINEGHFCITLVIGKLDEARVSFKISFTKDTLCMRDKLRVKHGSEPAFELGSKVGADPYDTY